MTAMEPVRRGRTLAVATTPDRVRRLRTAVDAAAGGRTLLLCTELSEPTPAAAAATAQLATLAAFTFAYATGKPVSTVLPVPDVTRDPGEARDRAAQLEWLTGYRESAARGPIGQADRWLSQLSLAPRFDAAEAAFLDRMTKAWAFATAYGGDPAEVAKVLSADRYLAWPASTSAHPRLIRESRAEGAAYGLLSPGVLCRPVADRPDSRRVGELVNPVVLRLRPGIRADELARLCGRLNPARTPGRLALLTPPAPAKRLGRYLTATAGHRPAWVLGCGSGRRAAPRLHRMESVLRAHGAQLGGVWLAGRGRWLEQVVRLATVLASRPTVPILDHTMTGAAG
ncbi:MAG TPA: hypothetical protein VFV67_23165 [Actinophytocola sp.]|uniref:hypothetical protein n=1 Tax=Actinophytocola sp. TaxID=1872138 RepID=UPI002DBDFDE4|nr:hypothetical protein [Actinophytocola sp.]HEU5473557.1 hypothetical protein [Actinophytocola sp.]